jgi:hypothetical protein
MKRITSEKGERGFTGNARRLSLRGGEFLAPHLGDL